LPHRALCFEAAARETLGFTSKTDTVVYALREVVRRGRRDDLKQCWVASRSSSIPLRFANRIGAAVIVVDSSVWIEAHRRPSSRTATTLNRLLDDDAVAMALPVQLELLAGVARRDRAALARGLSALPLPRPSADTWALVERWVPTAADKGQRFGLADWLIAALAREIEALFWSLDAEFDALEKLKIVHLYSA